jgi:hypothetical protein
VVEQSLKIVHLYICINSLVFAGAIVSTFVCNAGANTTIVRFFARTRERESCNRFQIWGGQIWGVTIAFYG